MVPNGWENKHLSEIASFSQGIQIPIENQYTFEGQNTCRFLRISDFVYQNEEPRFIDMPDSKFIVEEDDLSMIRYGSAGAGDLVRGLRGAIANNLFRVIPNELTVSKEYLWVYLRQEKVKDFLFSGSTSSTMPAVSFKLVGKVPVAVPPLPEQRKIAQILSTWDRGIATTEKLIDASKQQKKALMQQLLTSKKRLVDPETGKAFEGDWEEVKFSTFGKCIRGVSYKPTQISENENENTIRLLRSTNIQEGKLNDKDLVILPREVVKPAQLMIKNDLAICMANGSKLLVGKSAPFNGNERAYTVGAFCAIFRPTKTYSHSLVQHVFNSAQYRHQLKVILAGSAINNLKGSDIESMVIALPVNIKEQQKIASVLTAADKDIELLEAKLAHLKQEKKALMQQLLTGKRRVSLSS
ncbi:restriction endonuclease subunit S [Vibrio aestuarianus]|uniref:restriction endonuclease subunit S n=1 Tax=Vibrio aestuarianus TaxID=28171 RepID=UPI00237C760A|nr:restriction endonuclease subunit S [Vibrio aestuarianus]MDE1239818.1 restriction endonuclease subunit S [Vibrio aestuarianus]